MKKLLELFLVFARIGAFTFGGGYAMLPLLQKEIVDKRGWATDEELVDYYAIGQCTPGIIAVNTATFIGYKQRGIPGAIFATFGIVFPSLVIITTIAAFFVDFQKFAIVNHAFGGIRVVVVALITDAIIKLWKKSVKDWVGIIVFAISFLAIVFLDISPIVIIIASAALGIIIKHRRMDAQ